MTHSTRYIDSSDMQRLNRIAEHLSQSYPPDWLELFWTKLNFDCYFLAFLLGTALVRDETQPLVLCTLPSIILILVFELFPSVFFQRAAHTPSWAHTSVKLAYIDYQTISCVISRLRPVQRYATAQYLPAMTGDRFWLIYRHAQRYDQGHAYLPNDQYVRHFHLFWISIVGFLFLKTTF